MDFVIAALAAVSAGVFTNPLDVLKVRMQLQGELSKKGQYNIYYKNFPHAAYTITKNEGLLALQKGLVPALWMQLIFNGIKLGTYQTGHSKGYITDAHGNIILYKSILLAGCSGVIGQFWASPFNMLKIRLQSRAAKTIAVGYQHDYGGTWEGLKSIFRKQGFRRLFGSILIRAFVASISQLTTFTYTKQLLTKNNVFPNMPYVRSFVASLVGGVVITAIVTPFDLVSIRLVNQGIDSEGRGLLYKNYMDCVTKIYKLEGFLGFYKGIVPAYIRMGTHTILCLGFWDVFKDFYMQRSCTYPSTYHLKSMK